MDKDPSSSLVFISYSPADRPIAEAACQSLETNGTRCWMAPRNLDAGVPQDGQIMQGLRESEVIVLLFSQHANESQNVLREIEFANEQRLPILSVRLDTSVIGDDLAYYLRVAQWHDVSGRQSDQERVADLSGEVARLFTSAESGKQPPTTPAVAAAARFGDFEILAAPDGRPLELGRGGMGVTYRARQISMGGREVALKVINPNLMGDDGVRKRFLREAQIAGAIEHPSVALVYSRGQEGDSYFYAMQLVPGVDLDKYVKARGPLSVFQALSVTAQVAAALEAARVKGLIHRDIKPSNIMVVEDRRHRLQTKLIDFGLAKNVGGANVPQSIVSGDQFVGTFAFASPEQCRRQELDTRSDLYSLGVTLWFLLAGSAPFRGSPEEVSGSHLFQEPPFDALPPLPPSVIELLKSLLAKDPAKRPQAPAELEDRVEEFLRTLPADSTAPSSVPVLQGETVALPAPGDDLGLQTLVGSPVLSSYLAPAVGQTREERFHLVEELREGVSGRLFRAREVRGDTSREVGLKFLHPSIVSDDEKQTFLREQFDRVASLAIDHLVAHYSLELSAQPPFLVREWLNGFSFSALLRWRQTLSAKDLIKLLTPLPALLDQLSKHSLALTEVSLGKIFLTFPPEIAPETFSVLAKGSSDKLLSGQLKLNPLSLRGLAKRSSNMDSDPTMLSTSRLLALSQAKIGIRGKAPVPLLGQLIYELLSGNSYPPQGTDSYSPLTSINEAGNRLLRTAIVTPTAAGGFPVCQSFWEAFAPTLDLSRRATPVAIPALPPRTVKLPSPVTPPPTTPAPTKPPQPTPAPAPVYRPPTPSPAWPTQAATTFTGGPATLPKAVSPTARKPSPWMLVWIFVIVGVVGLGLLTILTFSAIRFMFAGPPSVSPTNTVTPAPSVATAGTSPQTTPNGETPNQSAATTNATNLFNQARNETEAKQYDKAIADYTEAIRLKPDYAEAYSNRAFVYTFVGKFDQAIADCNEAIRIKPDLAEAYKNRANPHNQLKQYDDAIVDCNEAIRLNPNYAEAFANRATSYVDLKQYDKAIADCDEAIRLKPELFQAYDIRASAYDYQGQYDKAIADLNEVIRLQPNLADAYIDRGYAYLNLGQYDASVADSTEAIRLNPNLALAYNNRAYARLNLKQYDAAIADCTEAIRLNPNLAFAYGNRGNAYINLKQYKAGIADCTEAIRLNPSFVSAYIDRGDAYLNLKQYDASIADSTEAIRLNPNAALAYNNRGFAYICLKQYNAGIADSTEAIRLNPNLGLAYLNRSLAYQQVGEIQKSKADRAKGEELQGITRPGSDRRSGR
jgi:serine/threonine protein kinase